MQVSGIHARCKTKAFSNFFRAQCCTLQVSIAVETAVYYLKHERKGRNIVVRTISVTITSSATFQAQDYLPKIANHVPE